MTCARLGCTWQEQQAGKRGSIAEGGRSTGGDLATPAAGGILKPSSNRPAVRRERAGEGGAVRRDPSARGSVFAHHEEPSKPCRPPSAPARDLTRQPRLPVERDEGGLDVQATDFTSTTSSVAVAGWNARRSIEPRSPRIENETSVATSQPRDVSHRTTVSTSAACDSSNSRSSASPFQSSRQSSRAPSASASVRSIRMVSRSALPRSTREMAVRETPACHARSTCRHPRRRRSARTESPNRTVSIAAKDGPTPFTRTHRAHHGAAPAAAGTSRGAPAAAAACPPQSRARRVGPIRSGPGPAFPGSTRYTPRPWPTRRHRPSSVPAR
jgi:hypothetical protein